MTAVAALVAPRRRLAVAVATPPLAALYVRAQPDPGWWVLPGAVALGLVAAVVLASYVPVAGSWRRPDVGCSPCAAVAAGTLIAAALLLDSVTGPGGVLTALAVLAFGVLQRLGAPASCPTPTPTPGPTRGRAPLPITEREDVRGEAGRGDRSANGG